MLEAHYSHTCDLAKYKYVNKPLYCCVDDKCELCEVHVGKRQPITMIGAPMRRFCRQEARYGDVCKYAKSA